MPPGRARDPLDEIPRSRGDHHEQVARLDWNWAVGAWTDLLSDRDDAPLSLHRREEDLEGDRVIVLTVRRDERRDLIPFLQCEREVHFLDEVLDRMPSQVLDVEDGNRSPTTRDPAMRESRVGLDILPLNVSAAPAARPRDGD